MDIATIFKNLLEKVNGVGPNGDAYSVILQSKEQQEKQNQSYYCSNTV